MVEAGGGGDLVPGDGVTPSLSAGGSPGYPDGGGLHLMLHIMPQLSPIMVTPRLMVTQDIPLQGHHPLSDYKKEVSMPFGMGPAGWFMWPYMAQWLQYWYPYYGIPYSYPFAPLSKEQEVAMLKDQARVLKDQLDRINARLKELGE